MLLEDFLEEVVLFLYKEKGRTPIGENVGGMEEITLIFGEVHELTLPENAISADLSIDVNRRTLNTLARYKANNGEPTTNSGFQLKMDDKLTLSSEELKLFKIQSVIQNREVILRVQYYKTAQQTQA